MWHSWSSEDVIIHSDEKNVPQLFKGHTHEVITIDICEEKYLIVTGGYDQTVRIWNFKDNTLLKIFYEEFWITSVVISKQVDLLAYGGDIFGRVILKDISDLNFYNNSWELKGHQSTIVKLKFSNEAKYLISSSKDKTVRVWNVQNKSELYKYNLDNCPFGVAISSENKLLSSGSIEGEIKIWNFSSQKLLCTQIAHVGKTQIVFSKNKQILVSNGKDSVKMWSLQYLTKGYLQLINKFKNNEFKPFALLTTDFRFIITYNSDGYLIVRDSNHGSIVKKTKFDHFLPGARGIVGINIKMNIFVLSIAQNIIVQKLD